MNAYRLISLDGGPATSAWRLTPGATLQIGRRPPGQEVPDINLYPDLLVSRNHARLWFKEGAWWIADAQSVWGTFVEGTNIQDLDAPTSLPSWSVIQIGQRQLMLVPPNGHVLLHRDLCFGLEVSPTVNFSLVRCGVPLVSRVVVRNSGLEPSQEAILRLKLGSYAHAEGVHVGHLPPEKLVELEQPDFHFDHQALEALGAYREVQLEGTLNGKELHGEPVLCKLLPYNEWSMIDAYHHRLSLAAFVQPNHPLIALLTTEACGDLSMHASAAQVLEAVYTHLYASWRMTYQKEPRNTSGQRGQRIRLPHDVLYDVHGRQGTGTCLDLALLIAACLEARHHQPFLAVLDVGSHWHVLVGCRTTPHRSPMPVLTGVSDPYSGLDLTRDVVWVDPNGCTREEAYREPFAQVRETARQHLAQKPFRFALDVAAARTVPIAPLPFAGTPQPSEEQREALLRAKQAACTMGRSRSSVLLLYGLIAAPEGSMQNILAKLGIAPDEALRRLEAFIAGYLEGGDCDGKSRDFMRAEEGAALRAKLAGSPVILDQHLLCALLDTHSKALRRALSVLGTSLDELGKVGCRGSDALFTTTFFR